MLATAPELLIAAGVSVAARRVLTLLLQVLVQVLPEPEGGRKPSSSPTAAVVVSGSPMSSAAAPQGGGETQNARRSGLQGLQDGENGPESAQGPRDPVERYGASRTPRTRPAAAFGVLRESYGP